MGGAEAQALAAAGAMTVVDGRDLLFHSYGLIGAGILAGAAAAAQLSIEYGAGGVLVGLAQRRSAAHAQVLDRSSEAGRQVSLEVGDHNHAISGGDLAGDLDLLKMLSRNGHLPEAVSLQAVGDDHRRTGYGAAEAVLFGGLQMYGGIASAAAVEGIGVCEKGPGPLIQDLLRYGPDQDRTDIGVIAQLAEVDLDGGQVTLLYDFRESGGVK